MQEPGPSPRRDWVIIGSLIAVVAVSWVGFLVYWMVHRSGSAKPVVPQVVHVPATQTTRPVVASQPRPLPVRPEPPVVVAPPTQPAPATRPVASRDAALLAALQRAEELKNQGKQREALAELQKVLAAGSGTASSASQPSEDVQGKLGSLLGLLSSSSQPGQSLDNDALMKAALQMMGNSVGNEIDLIDDLDAEMSGRHKANKPQEQAQRAPIAQADIVAYVFGEPVSRQEIGGAADGPTDVSIARLNQRILEPLLDIYAKNQGIKAAPGEVAVYQRVTRTGAGAVAPAPGRRPQPRERPTPPPVDPAAEAAVVRWKVARSLYEQYKGTVILGRSDRLEPVGAYREFLKEQQEKLAFRIEDAKYRERFWAYYDRDFGSRVVPPEKVNFGTPPWMKPASSGGGQ